MEHNAEERGDHLGMVSKRVKSRELAYKAEGIEVLEWLQEVEEL